MTSFGVHRDCGGGFRGAPGSEPDSRGLGLAWLGDHVSRAGTRRLQAGAGAMTDANRRGLPIHNPWLIVRVTRSAVKQNRERSINDASPTAERPETDLFAEGNCQFHDLGRLADRLPAVRNVQADASKSINSRRPRCGCHLRRRGGRGCRRRRDGGARFFLGAQRYPSR
jgi:hypothetical protein